MEKILEKESKQVILLGNEAIIRGALEAGVQFVSTYPGTPASEIGDTFYRIFNSQVSISKQKGISFYFEYSTNEKVALEAAAGASFCGLRSLVAMKHFGLNVASDFLMPLVYSGIKGGMVVVVADDPNCWSSAQSEQSTRGYSYLAHIPTLEPSDPQECKDFTKFAFKISEKFEIPVLIRTTTRVAHQSAPVMLGKINLSRTVLGTFEKNPKKFVTMPPRVLEMKKELFQKIEKIRGVSEKSDINEIQNPNDKYQVKSKVQNPNLGILCSGISYLYVKEALKELKINLPVLKIGFFYPLPESKIKDFIKNLKKVLIVEELEPYLEKEIERLAKDTNPKIKIFGKKWLPEVGELKPEYVISAITNLAGKKYQQKNFKNQKLSTKHISTLCPSCPYWLVFSAVKQAVAQEEVVFGGEIGCYMLAGLPPHEIQDYLYCMGSSVGIGHGIKKATKNKQKLIAFVGDSSFFHAGIPPLINAVYNKSNPLIIILDNSTTAMTGQQPHPGNVIRIEDVVLACGVKHLRIVDPVNQKEMIETIKGFLEKKEVSVIIARRPCIRL